MDAARLHKVVDEQIRRLKEQGIVVPENFRTKLKRDVIKNYASNYRLVSRTTLESIIRMCKLWKPYLASEEDWNKLVCEKLLEMYRIHAAVISTHEDLPSYIGNATAIAPNVNLPECRTTWTCFTGEIFGQDGFGSPKLELN
ncbi:MAG: hypothetical protein ACI4VO_03550 [Clostridia bacterium]|jgi:hypothetical protein